MRGARAGLALDKIRDALATVQGLRAHRASIGGWRHRLGLSRNKPRLAREIKWSGLAKARHIWHVRRQSFMRNMLETLAFRDETSLKTNLARTAG